MNDLPKGWVESTLGTLLSDLRNGVFVSRPGTEPTDRSILRISAVRPMALHLDEVRYIPQSTAVANAMTSTVQEGDLLFTRYSGNAEYVGACARVREHVPDLFYPDKIIRGRVIPSLVDPGYLEAAMNSPRTRETIRKLTKTTAGQVGISGSNLRSVPVLVAPYPEQLRIVAAIEEQFSRLDAGEAALQRVRQNLKRMRSAALRQLVGFEFSDELPRQWKWMTIAEVAGDQKNPVLTGPFGTTLSRSDFVRDGVPVLTIGCLTPGGIQLEDAPRVLAAKAQTLERYALKRGDILFSRMATVGRAAVVGDAEAGSIINYHLMRLRLDQTIIRPEYVALLCRGSRAIKKYLTESNHGVTRPGINTKQLLKLPVALPPLHDQQTIIDRIRDVDDCIDDLEGQVTRGLRRVGFLRSSILATAFSGQLVPQNSNDEPASVLLERIATERVSSTGHEPSRSRTRLARGTT